jgi:hypothetical protein
MNIINDVIISRVTELLDEIEVIGETIVNENEDRKSSTSVSEFTKVNEISSEYLKRLVIINMQIVLLKGLVV